MKKLWLVIIPIAYFFGVPVVLGLGAKHGFIDPENPTAFAIARELLTPQMWVCERCPPMQKIFDLLAEGLGIR
jgi:hypothetical protein